LAWLKHQRRKQQDANDDHYIPPHIIVVPVSVLPNWMREFETFAPHMKVIKYHGSMAEREMIQDELHNHLPGRRTYPKQCLDALIVPVTYYQKEKSDDRKFLNKFHFDYLVVDEAHMLKNSLSLRYKTLNRLKTQHRLLLTGTPVQNSPQELLNMLCFIMPLFSKGSESLDHDDADENTSVGDRMLQHFVDAEKEKSGDEHVAYAKLKQLFAPFVLRRKKEDVIAQLLPPKTRLVEYVELDPSARKIYNSILEDHVKKNASKAMTVTIGEHLFTNLRKAAHHPLLLRTRHNTPSEVDHLVTNFHKYKAFAGEGSTKAKVGEELSKYNDFQIHLTALDLIEENPHRRPDLERYILDESALFSSAKFSRLQKLLPDLIEKQGHRVLIFSGWTSCLDLLGCLMEQLGMEYLRMDGSCPSDVRQALIDEFNSNGKIPVFLLSTRACGLGINLTAADTCIMHDLDFNPFNDLQAEGMEMAASRCRKNISGWRC
jgi:SWI/SNF-related matrix-associated actin-dependent regulator of chromatin subfamily A containing DEAD/H box 1